MQVAFRAIQNIYHFGSSQIFHGDMLSKLLFGLVATLPLLSHAVDASPLDTRSPDFWRYFCQAPTPDPLLGCPPGTLLVGPSGHFQTVQAAVASLPNNTHPYNILIQPGNYTEQVNVTRPGPVTLLGVTSRPRDPSSNTVNIIWHNATGAGVGTEDNLFTSVLTVAPSQNASATGAGPTGDPVTPGTPFGNTDFRAYNVDFTNLYKPYSAGPSLAISISYANAGFYYCGIYSYQDTVCSPLLPSYCSPNH